MSSFLIIFSKIKYISVILNIGMYAYTNIYTCEYVVDTCIKIIVLILITYSGAVTYYPFGNDIIKFSQTNTLCK